MNRIKIIKISFLALGGLTCLILLTLRATGLAPGHPSAEEYLNAGRSARPGLWLKGEVFREPVKNWDWVKKFSNPFSENATELETRTWYGIPHSVTILLVPLGEKLYLQSSGQTFRLEKKFPYGKAWWRNIERDPRVRLKIDGKLYGMTAVLIQDKAEVTRLRGGLNPTVKETDANGNEYITEEWHYWRVFQRNIPEY